MGRAKLIRSSEYPYHVTARANHKVWFSIPLEEVWNISMKSFKIAQKKHPIELHSFVLMQNHYHMFLTTPNEDLDLFMYEFNKHFSLLLREKTSLVNRMFGGRYKKSIVCDQTYYMNVMKYIYCNPLRKHLIDKAENYPFSTLYYLHRGFPFAIALSPKHPDSSYKEFIQWVNQSHSQHDSEILKNALNRNKFAVGRNSQNSKAKKLENQPFFLNALST